MTAVLAGRGDPRSRLTASATVAVALLDAWFDVTTSAAGSPRRKALIYAVGELSLVGYCVALATPRSDAWDSLRPTERDADSSGADRGCGSSGVEGRARLDPSPRPESGRDGAPTS